MKHESQLTARQAWESFSESIQSDVNEALSRICEIIESANAELAMLHVKGSEDAERFAREFIEYLDEEWDYHGDIFFISGKWHEAKVYSGEDTIVCKQEKGLAFSTAHSNGFDIKMIGDEDASPRIGLSFTHMPVEIKHEAMMSAIVPISFAEPDEVSLQYLRPQDSEAVSSNLDEVRDSLERADSLLQLMTEHRASDFYDLSPKRQRKAIDSIVSMIESTMPSPESFDKLTANIETRLVYLKGYQGNDFMTMTARDKHFVLRGNVLGVTATPSNTDGVDLGYTRPEECHLIYQGISLIVQAEDYNFDLDDYDGVFVVPIRLAKKIELDLV